MIAKKWTLAEDEILRTMWASGHTRASIALAIAKLGVDRTPDSMGKRAAVLGLGLRATVRTAGGGFRIIADRPREEIPKRPPLFPGRGLPPVLDFGLVDRIIREARQCSIPSN